MTTSSKIMLASLAVAAALTQAKAQTATPPATAPAPAAAPAPSTPPPTNAMSSADLSAEGFWGHLNDAFLQQMGTPAWSPPDPKNPPQRRGFPPPFDSPPYPDGDWQNGGVPCEIGDPGLTPDYPITYALDQVPTLGSWMKDNRVKFYGWVDVSGNLSSSHNTGPGIYDNFPTSYDEVGNAVVLDQAVVYLEKIPNEFQTDHYDWGFRISAIYGLDYRYTIADGIVSNQLLQRNKEFGYDFPMVYYNWYDPFVAMGLNITIGRIISEPDIEAQLAPNNLMSSHSLLYTFDPYTQVGIFPTLKLTNNWQLQTGFTPSGTDVEMWVHGPYGAHPTFLFMVQWISDNQKDSVYFGDDSINNSHFGYNNMGMLVQTWTHKFNEKWWMTTESWYMWQKDCPVAGSPAALAATASGFVPSGAFPDNPYASEWALLNYVQYRMAGNTFLSVRNEYFDDKNGQRTGFATPYIENSIGLTWWPNELLTVRPELRYEHALTATPYDNGTKAHQRTIAMDVIWHF